MINFMVFFMIITMIYYVLSIYFENV